MANREHVKIIRQGVEVWNQWRKEHFDLLPDLSTPSLISPDIGKVSELESDSEKAGLSGMNLSGVNFGGVNLSGTNLSRANLSGANLVGAIMSLTDLREAALMKADLAGVDLTGAELRGANFSEAIIGGTIFADIDLRTVKGLETVSPFGPSTIGVNTIIRSHGQIPENFLRKVGVPEPIIEAIPSLIGSLKPIDYYTCFISYSSKDQDFAERLYADLQAKGVRCWYAPEDMKIGDKIRPRIDETIRLFEKLLVVLSEHSIGSDWVEFEVETALAKESERNSTVLFPIRLDETVMESTTSWAAHIKRTRNIGDFRYWKSHDDYHKAFTRLLRDLKLDTPKLPS